MSERDKTLAERAEEASKKGAAPAPFCVHLFEGFATSGAKTEFGHVRRRIRNRGLVDCRERDAS